MSAPVLFEKLTPSQINLIKNAKNHFLLMKKLKNTESAQLCLNVSIFLFEVPETSYYLCTIKFCCLSF